MKHPLESIHDELSLTITYAGQLLTLIEATKACSRVNPDEITAGPNAQSHVRELVSQAAQNHLNLPIQTGTLLLYVVGQFEQYIKNQVMAISEYYASQCHCFAELPNKMQLYLISLTAEVIQKPSRYQYDNMDVKKFVVQLASNISATTGLSQINKECLVVTDQNMRPEVLNELLKRVEINDVWKELSKQAAVKIYLAEENEVVNEKKLKEILNTIMEERNGITHPSTTPTFPDVGKVREYVRYFEIVGKAICDLLIQKWTVFKPQVVV